jgi:hypothetical protein
VLGDARFETRIYKRVHRNQEVGSDDLGAPESRFGTITRRDRYLDG